MAVGLKSAACTKTGTTLLVPIVRPTAPDFPGAPIVLSAQNRGNAYYPVRFGKYLRIVGTPARTTDVMSQKL